MLIIRYQLCNFNYKIRGLRVIWFRERVKNDAEALARVQKNNFRLPLNAKLLQGASLGSSFLRIYWMPTDERQLILLTSLPKTGFTVRFDLKEIYDFIYEADAKKNFFCIKQNFTSNLPSINFVHPIYLMIYISETVFFHKKANKVLYFLCMKCSHLYED